MNRQRASFPVPARVGLRFLTTLLLAFWVGPAWALGLGQATVQSYLQQPLEARIDLISRSEAELATVTASMASAADFRVMGLRAQSVGLPLEFTVVRDIDDPHIRVRSRTPITEPVLQVVVEVVWGSGRMLRQYTLFLDPPTFQSAAPLPSSRRPESVAEVRPAAPPRAETRRPGSEAPAQDAAAPVAERRPPAVAQEAPPPEPVIRDTGPPFDPAFDSPAVLEGETGGEALAGDEPVAAAAGESARPAENADAAPDPEGPDDGVATPSMAASDQGKEAVVTGEPEMPEMPAAEPIEAPASTDGSAGPSMEALAEAGLDAPVEAAPAVPDAEQPAPEQPGTEQTVTEQPATEQTVPEQTVTEQTVTEQQAEELAAAEPPATEPGAADVADAEAVDQGSEQPAAPAQDPPTSPADLADQAPEPAVPTVAEASRPEPERASQTAPPELPPVDLVFRAVAEPPGPAPRGDAITHRVQGGETLWSLSKAWAAERGLTVHQMMLSVQQANPDAFREGNINRMMAGSVLRVPDRAGDSAWSPREALLEVMRQEQAYRNRWVAPATDETLPSIADAARPVEAVPAGDVSLAGADAEPDDGRLELVPPSEDEGGGEEALGQGSGDSGVEEGASLVEELARTQEELANARQENAYLNERISELEAELARATEAMESGVADTSLAELEERLRVEREAGPSEAEASADPERDEGPWWRGNGAWFVIGLLLVVGGLVFWLRSRSELVPIETEDAAGDDSERA